MGGVEEGTVSNLEGNEQMAAVWPPKLPHGPSRATIGTAPG